MTQDEELDNINKKKLAELMKRSSEGAGPEPRPVQDSKPIVLTDATFSSEVSKHPVMVVDFWAPWCGPCRIVGPVIEQLAGEYAGRVTFGKLNVDENPQVSATFGIRSIPTMIVFKDGRAVDGLLGAVPKQQIEGKFLPYLGKAASPRVYE